MIFKIGHLDTRDKTLKKCIISSRKQTSQPETSQHFVLTNVSEEFLSRENIKIRLTLDIATDIWEQNSNK